MTNSTASMGYELVPDLATILATEERVPEEWTLAAVTPEALEIVGPWYWGPTPVVIRALLDGWLDMRGLLAPAQSSRLRPGADGTWIGLDGYYAGDRLRVARDDGGTVRQLDLASFCLTRTPYDPMADLPGGVYPAGWRAAE